MSNKLLQATDVASGSFSLLLMAMVVTTLLLIIGTAWVSKRWKLPVTLAGMVTLIGAMHYFHSSMVWFDAQQITIIYRYIDWQISMPLQVMALYFFIGTISQPPVGLFWRLLIVSILMVLARYLGDVNLMHPTLGFLIGLVGWLYVLGEVFFGRLSEINSNSGNEIIQRGFFWLRLIVTIGWALYPLVYFISRFAGGVEGPKLSIVYNLADLINQIGFGLAILTVAVKDSAYSSR
jgi:bacteriorhodopsin